MPNMLCQLSSMRSVLIVCADRMVSVGNAFRQKPEWVAYFVEGRKDPLWYAAAELVLLVHLKEGRMLPPDTLRDIKHFLDMCKVSHSSERAA